MITYELKAAHKNQPDEIVWAFDLGKGSIGEAVRCGNEYLLKSIITVSVETMKVVNGLPALNEKK